MTMTAPAQDSTVSLILEEVPNLRRVARRLARCESDADDLVQGTLLRAYGARERFEPGSSVRAWTTTILRRLFLTGAIRTKWRNLQNDTDAGGPLESAVGRPLSPHDLSPRNEHSRAVRELSEHLEDDVKKALDRIPEVYRTAFLLSAIRDMSCAEISRELGVPVSTVMSRVHRARERLRADLAPHRRALLARAAGAC